MAGMDGRSFAGGPGRRTAAAVEEGSAAARCDSPLLAAREPQRADPARHRHRA